MRTGAAFFLPKSSLLLHSSDGIDAFCGEAGTSWRQILGLLVPGIDGTFHPLGKLYCSYARLPPAAWPQPLLGRERDTMGFTNVPPAVSRWILTAGGTKKSLTTTGRAEIAARTWVDHLMRGLAAQ